MTRPRVLHVAESLGSGVAVAIRDYVVSTPEYEHRVLGYWRPGAHIGSGLDDVAPVIPLEPGVLRQARRLRREIAAFRPDIVHVHSSIAGAYARALASRCVPIVYTPHCYAFERRDLAAPARVAFWSVEAVLSRRTAAFVAVSPREAALSRAFRSRARVAYVPNVVRLEQERVARTEERPLDVVAAGRICEQKDVRFFAAAARAAAASPIQTSWTWVGGGDAQHEAVLRGAGVAVTGWLSREETVGRLAAADVYAHTAAWEGAPITLIEAAALGLPIVAREIPALASLELPALVADPAELARRVLELGDRAKWARAATASRSLALRHRPEEQRRALLELYRAVAPDAAVAGTGESPRASQLVLVPTMGVSDE